MLNRSQFQVVKLRQLFSIVVTSLAIVAATAPPGFSALIMTRLQQVLEESSVIATGQCIGGEDKQRYRIDIKEVLRGEIPLGEQSLPTVPDQTPPIESSPCVAFINPKGQLQFIAAPFVPYGKPRPQDLEQNLLFVFGFYDDFNAHHVAPHFITLNQLENYIKTGRLVYKFRGQIPLFSKERREVVPVATRIRAEYELFSGEHTVQEAPTVAGLPFPPAVAISEDSRFDLDIVLNYGGFGNKRRFELAGTVNGVDLQTGELLLNFVTLPLLYTDSDLQRYLANPKFGEPWYNISIQFKDGKRWTLRMGDRHGSIMGTLLGFRNRAFPIPYGLSTRDPNIRIAPCSTIDKNLKPIEERLAGRLCDRIEVPLGNDGTMFLAVDSSTLSKVIPDNVWSMFSTRDNELLETLVQKPLDCMVRIEGGRQPMQPTPCRLNLDRVDFKPI
jgi:hypothetical protein